MGAETSLHAAVIGLALLLMGSTAFPAPACRAPFPSHVAEKLLIELQGRGRSGKAPAEEVEQVGWGPVERAGWVGSRGLAIPMHAAPSLGGA